MRRGSVQHRHARRDDWRSGVHSQFANRSRTGRDRHAIEVHDRLLRRRPQDSDTRRLGFARYPDQRPGTRAGRRVGQWTAGYWNRFGRYYPAGADTNADDHPNSYADTDAHANEDAHEDADSDADSNGDADGAAGKPSLDDARMGIRTGVDCLSEICVCPPGPSLPSGMPDSHLACTSDDPTCDAVAGDNACTFTFRMCFNMVGHEDRFFCNAQGPVTSVQIMNPRQGTPRTRVDGENVSAIEAALVRLGGGVGGYSRRSMVFNPPLAATVCTDPIPFTVSLGQRQGSIAGRKFRLSYRVYQSVRLFDGDDIFFRCNP